MLKTVISLVLLLSVSLFGISQNKGTQIITWNDLKGCIELNNGNTRVVLDPNIGGRVVEYSVGNKNVLHESLPDSSLFTETELGYIYPPGGRFDIGPEKIIPKRPQLSTGKWTAEITDDFSARLTSIKDKATGVQLVRDFTLSENDSRLICKQTIINISDKPKKYCHWSRTFAKGNGISLVPLNKNSRYPHGYIQYGPGLGMIYNVEPDPNIKKTDNILQIIGAPKYPKFAMDCTDDWLAYLSVNNLLFVKRFPVYADKQYGEMLANSVSVWYYKSAVCEIEPIGPWQTIKPGDSINYTEEWWLFSYQFPKNRKTNLNEVLKIVDGCKPATFETNQLND